MTAISNDQAKIHIEAMLGELLRHDADENHPRILAMQKAIAALAPPSGEGVDAVVARACGVYDGAMIRLHGEESICNSDAMREVIEACAPKCTRFDCPCEMQVADCRYKSTTPQSAPVDGGAVAEYRGAQRLAMLLRNHRNYLVRYAALFPEGSCMAAEIDRMIELANSLTTPPPASQERDGEPSQADMTRLWRNRWISERTEFYRPTVETYESARARAEGDAAEYEEQFSAAYERITASPTSSASEASINSHEIDRKLIPDAADQAKPLDDFISAQKPVPADIQAVISKQWPKYADAADQAKPDDCPFCGQPQAGELPPRCAAARTLGNETLVEVALQAAGRASLIDSEIHRSRYSECRTELLRRLAGWGADRG